MHKSTLGSLYFLKYNLKRLILTRNHCPKRGISVQQLTYSEYGNPIEVLRVETKNIEEDTLQHNQVLVQWLASPINPSDINQIQGVYAIKPPLPAVGGNEGCALVLKTGDRVNNLRAGDYVIPANAGLGTWCSYGIYESKQLFPVCLQAKCSGLDVIATSMIQVNPSTAYRMLKDFVPLTAGDLIIQNGANSAVGRFVIEICRILRLKNVNVVRSRPEINQLKNELMESGATKVLTEEEFSESLRSDEQYGAKLALNCVGGRSSLQLVRTLAYKGCMVTYGGMSKKPVEVPTTSLIFNDIILRGFWMSKWYEQKENAEERNKMYVTLAEWYKNGKLSIPPHQTSKFEEFKESIKKSMESPIKYKQLFVNFTV